MVVSHRLIGGTSAIILIAYRQICLPPINQGSGKGPSEPTERAKYVETGRQRVTFDHRRPRLSLDISFCQA